MSIRDFFGFIGLWFKRILNIFSMGMCVFFSIAFFSDSYEKTVPLVLLIILFILLSLFNAFYYFIRSEHLRIILTDCFRQKTHAKRTVHRRLQENRIVQLASCILNYRYTIFFR